jgi:predicted transglutaminase-like cysteine proteinase
MTSKLSTLLAGFVLALLAGQALPSMAHEAEPAPLRTQVAALPPAGMIMFCRSNAAHCRPVSASRVTMGDELMVLLHRVNSQVNRSIRPMRDSGRDKWQVGVRSGDCEDYVLTKRAQLIRMGVPAGALRIATTTTRQGEPHAILVVKTSAGDYVLDNLSASVRKLGSTGYRIRLISTPNPMVWAAG